ncbi:hypothetical protein AAC387_Pa02g1739 [Persea americana]
MIRLTLAEKPWFLALATFSLLGGFLILSISKLTSDRPFLCSSTFSSSTDPTATNSLQRDAVLHYATSATVPQQSLAEIRVSFDVLRRLSPCNFLVFGLGHDSLMWSSFNPRGTTLFLEEDPKWVQSVLKDAPSLRAHTVRYRTRLSDANRLLSAYRSEPSCLLPSAAALKGNVRCELALSDLPEEVYEREWDLIMIDAPRGYAGDLPGRMGAIYSAAVMARSRKGEGVTHVFLHDVNRRVERVYAEEFLCRKNRVHAVRRLWHFAISPGSNSSFC